MIAVTSENYPTLCDALALIETDNGGHLIGTVYPGEPIDLERFEIPEFYAEMLAPAEAGLARLREIDEQELEDFVIGEHSDQYKILTRQGDLEEAHHLLNEYFNGWPESRPRDGSK